jgi:hypothetical protein
MIIDDGMNVDSLLAAFGAEHSLSELDRAILEHAIDTWPLTGVARQFQTTVTALHRRRRVLLADFREYLERRGIFASTDLMQ